MASYIPYRYSLDIKWNNSGEEVPVSLPPDIIKNMTVDYDYDRKNMPIILLTCNISKKILDRMIRERETSTILLEIKKFSIDPTSSKFTPIVKSSYVKDEYIYFLYSDINYKKDIDFYNKDNTEGEDVYVQVVIGLLKLDLINGNKKTINAVYRDIKLIDIILLNTKHMGLLVEPIPNDTVLKEVLIPPITSISKLLKYLNDMYVLYDNRYRYFLDFDRMYLLSSTGNIVESSDDEFNTIILNIDNPRDMVSKVHGVFKDEESKSYIIEIEGSSTFYHEDSKTDNLYNNVVCIDSEGKKTELDLNIMNTEGSTKKDKIFRTYNVDTDKLIKHDIESSGTVLRIIKNDIDSSILTINKHIFVNNALRKEYSGQYLLSSKKEMYIKDGDSYVQHVVILLRRLKPDTI